MNNDERNIQTISKKLNYDETTIGKRIIEFDLNDIVIETVNSSSYETELVNYLKSLTNLKIEKNVKNILTNKNQEIDIYIPDMKLGIEFNGSFWHSEDQKQQNYHQKKSLDANNVGIFIYHIFEYEWENPILKEKIKNQIKMLICGHSKRIPAKNTIIKEISKKDKKEFLNKYHLQGNDHSNIELGLFTKDTNQLISCMTFCKPRFTKGCDWELSRFCNEADTQVIGGASKLLKYFIKKYCSDNEVIVTYSDIAKAKGSVYSNIGFSEDSISKPSYVWWKSHKEPISRYKCQMKNEIKTMKDKDYVRIFNSGNKVWKMKIKK